MSIDFLVCDERKQILPFVAFFYYYFRVLFCSCSVDLSDLLPVLLSESVYCTSTICTYTKSQHGAPIKSIIKMQSNINIKTLSLRKVGQSEKTLHTFSALNDLPNKLNYCTRTLNHPVYLNDSVLHSDGEP
jgi:hypothetical protein